MNGLGIRSFSSVKVKVLLRELHRDHHPRFSLRAQGGKYCNLYKANVPGLKYGSCRFWQRTDLPLGSNMHGLKSGSCRFWQRTDSPPGSNMHGLKSGSCRFWQRTDSPPGSNMLRLAYADSGSACKLAGVQIIPLHMLANQILARTFSNPSLIRLRPQPLESSLGRVPQAADGICKQIS